MSLSRSPSPQPDGGWSTRGLTDRDSPPLFSQPLRGGMNGYAEDNEDQWAAAKASHRKAGGHPQIQSRNEGFFQRSRRKMQSTLPSLNPYTARSKDWRYSEKLGRGRWTARRSGWGSTAKTFVGNILRRFKTFFIVLAIVLLVTVMVSKMHMRTRYRSSARFGGGSRFVIIIASNEGGGVMEWKGPREWAIERDSVINKREYADRWGYHLEVTDMSTKKRYTHEWRESWEKVDTIRNAMARYPHAEWFWWLDLHTFIMEPSVSLQNHIFDDLSTTTYRDINLYNPMNITHPPTAEFLDPVSSSPVGDGLTSSIDMIIPQDCNGFNLGSFFLRRSPWTERLLDIWWDPVLYEQKHMEWDHKEQDALEHLYRSQPYFRTHVAFIQQRKINSFPPAACSVHGAVNTEGKPSLDPRFHYNEHDRDFTVNMAGCEWGRDCWAEMYAYRELSNRLNRSGWSRFKHNLAQKISGLFRLSGGGTDGELFSEKRSSENLDDDTETVEDSAGRHKRRKKSKTMKAPLMLI